MTWTSDKDQANINLELNSFQIHQVAWLLRNSKLFNINIMLCIIKLYGLILQTAFPPELLSVIMRLVQLGIEEVQQGQKGFFF